MGQAVWTGSISFGLVNIPVKLYPATEPKDVRFHLYDRRTVKRLRYERVTRDTDAPTFEPEALAGSAAAEDQEESPSPSRYEQRLPVAGAAAGPVERQDTAWGFER